MYVCRDLYKAFVEYNKINIQRSSDKVFIVDALLLASLPSCSSSRVTTCWPPLLCYQEVQGAALS